jgi:cytochrome oxidase Cu insertion factor (SCO1/SenC/PrrC family)
MTYNPPLLEGIFTEINMKCVAIFGNVFLLLFTALTQVSPTRGQEKVAQTTLKVGDEAPDFTLPSSLGGTIKLSDYRGKKNVVLAFYVLAFTGG